MTEHAEYLLRKDRAPLCPPDRTLERSARSVSVSVHAEHAAPRLASSRLRRRRRLASPHALAIRAPLVERLRQERFLIHYYLNHAPAYPQGFPL